MDFDKPISSGLAQAWQQRLQLKKCSPHYCAGIDRTRVSATSVQQSLGPNSGLVSACSTRTSHS